MLAPSTRRAAAAASEPGVAAIGTLLLEDGHLTQAQLEQVLIAQKRRRGRFGELAVRLRFVSQAALDAALARQYSGQTGLAGPRRWLPDDLVVAREPGSRFAEAMRALHGQLVSRWFGDTPAERALVVCSPDQGDGRSFVCANLAVAFAQLGHETLLIDADLRAPRQHEIFRIRDRMGLSAMLAGRAGMSEVRRIGDLPRLSLLPAGAVPPDPHDLLARGAFDGLLAELAGHYDAILIDTPAARHAADMLPLASAAGAALLLARRDHTRAPELSQLSGELGAAGVTVLGATLNSC
jgi:receptor protein-tyrosine kinase